MVLAIRTRRRAEPRVKLAGDPERSKLRVVSSLPILFTTLDDLSSVTSFSVFWMMGAEIVDLTLDGGGRMKPYWSSSRVQRESVAGVDVDDPPFRLNDLDDRGVKYIVESSEKRRDGLVAFRGNGMDWSGVLPDDWLPLLKLK